MNRKDWGIEASVKGGFVILYLGGEELHLTTQETHRLAKDLKKLAKEVREQILNHRAGKKKEDGAE